MKQVFLIFDADVVEAAHDDWESLIGAGIYTGPYAVDSLDSSGMIASRNDAYWQGTPALPGVEVSFVTDPNARILAVQNNEADIALYPPVAAKAVVDATPGIHFNAGTPGTGGFLGFMNIRSAPFEDVRVRRALMHAIDYEHIANTVFDGVLAPATGLYNPSFEWAVENYRTDRAAAEALLDEAGWTLGADGYRQKDGERLTIATVIYPQQPDLVPLSNDLQAQLREIGIEITIRMADDLYAALSEGGIDWDLGISSEGTSSWGATEPFLLRYVSPEGDRNFANYDNPDLNAWLGELRQTVEPARRNELLGEIQRLLVEEDPYVFAFNLHQGRVVVNDAYRDYQPGFALYHVSWETAPAEAP